MIPDIILVRTAAADDLIVQPDGTTIPAPQGEQRLALAVNDIKHANEANSSYSAEVALYTFALANFIQYHGIDHLYFVSSSAMLWTRSSINNSEMAALAASNPTAPIATKLQAFLADCDMVQFKFFMQTVRRFLTEDLPRVIATGDADWTALDWHVDSRCSSCDWLGYGRWLAPTERARVQASPSHYCAPQAEAIGHLSRVFGITRGARKTLDANLIPDTTTIATKSGNEVAFKKHSALKKERKQLPQRARTLQSGQLHVDPTGVVGSIARYNHLTISVSVDFDSGAGLLTGLGIAARLNFRNCSPHPGGRLDG
jgi:hypothetical protein